MVPYALGLDGSCTGILIILETIGCFSLGLEMVPNGMDT